MEDMEAPVTRRELKDELQQFGKKLMLDIGDEMARQIRAGQEETRAWLRTLDDQYRDLPKRVTTIEASELPSRVAKLEAAVFSPPRKRRRKAS